jgi:hypothetical protein
MRHVDVRFFAGVAEAMGGVGASGGGALVSIRSAAGAGAGAGSTGSVAGTSMSVQRRSAPTDLHFTITGLCLFSLGQMTHLSAC